MHPSIPALARYTALLCSLSCGAAGGGAGDDASDDPCVPGQSIGCECDDGTAGARVCEPDGIGYEECVCDGDASTGSSGVDSTVGTSDPETTAGSSTTAGPSTTSDPSGTDGEDSSGGVPIFQDDVVPILYAACGAANTGCHARNAYFPTAAEGCRGWLSLENEPLGSFFDDLDPDTQMPSEGPVPGCEDRSLHARLMDLAPWECGADARYVVPGSPEQSYIFQKLTNGTVCGDFRVMPPPDEGYEITPEAIAVLEAWITAGALP